MSVTTSAANNAPELKSTGGEPCAPEEPLAPSPVVRRYRKLRSRLRRTMRLRNNGAGDFDRQRPQTAGTDAERSDIRRPHAQQVQGGTHYGVVEAARWWHPAPRAQSPFRRLNRGSSMAITSRLFWLCKGRYMSHDVIEDRYARLFELPHCLGRRMAVKGFCLD